LWLWLFCCGGKRTSKLSWCTSRSHVVPQWVLVHKLTETPRGFNTYYTATGTPPLWDASGYRARWTSICCWGPILFPRRTPTRGWKMTF
jgi:hypothetical protein